MSVPPLRDLLKEVGQVVRRAAKAGDLDKITQRTVRREVEKKFGLENEVLDAKEYRIALKDATEKALEEESSKSSSEEELSTTKAKAKAKSPVRGNVSKTKRKSEAAFDSESDEDEGDRPKKVAKPKAKAVGEKERSKPKSTSKEVEKPTSASKPKAKNGREDIISATKQKASRKKDMQQYKTPEHVATSDMEQDEPYELDKPEHQAGPSKSKFASPVKAVKSGPSKIEPQPPSKRRKRAPAVKSDPESGVNDEEESQKKEKAKPSPKKENMANDEGDIKSETELSDLFDEPSKRGKKSKATEKEGKKKDKAPVKRKSGASSKDSGLSKDEETIKRLKSLVVACGVRKVWSKVFEDSDSPGKQIKKLKEILSELGMTSRFNLEHAKAIKKKRELAKELEEVQQFEKSVKEQSSRNQRRAAGKAEESDENESESEAEADSLPKKRSGNARTSIMAFLEDQSDEGD